MPGVSGVTVVTTLVCSFYFACEAAGAARARHSPCPLFRGTMLVHDSDDIHVARGRALVCLRCLTTESRLPVASPASPRGYAGQPTLLRYDRSRMAYQPKLRKQRRLVPLAGIEPALLAELDFESSASTSSATGAFAGRPEAAGTKPAKYSGRLLGVNRD